MALLQSAEIDQALEYFDRTHKRILAVTSELSEARWNFKPAPDRWSIAEILVHITMVQERILGVVLPSLATAPPVPDGHDRQTIDRIVYERIPDRTVKAKAPEFILPAGGSTPAESLDRVAVNYSRLAEYVTSTPDLREHGIESAPLKFISNGLYSHLDGLQWAVILVSHDQRHIRQIEELQADPGYPAN